MENSSQDLGVWHLGCLRNFRVAYPYNQCSFMLYWFFFNVVPSYYLNTIFQKSILDQLMPFKNFLGFIGPKYLEVKLHLLSRM